MRWLFVLFISTVISGCDDAVCRWKMPNVMVEIPNHIHVRGEIYEIKMVEQKEIPGLWGECNKDKKLIRLLHALPKEKLGPILMHEVLHAVFFETYDQLPQKLEEFLVRNIAEPLYRTLTAHEIICR